MSEEEKNKVEYLVMFVGEFAKRYKLPDDMAYKYLSRYKAIDFLNEQYGIAHTLRFEDVVDDMAMYCRNNGGTI